MVITGASGAVGLVLRVGLGGEHDIMCVDRVVPAGVHDGERWIEADIADQAALRRALAGADVVIHLAAAARTWSTWEEIRGPNIDGLHAVLEASCDAGVRQFIFASSGHVAGLYGNAPTRLIRVDDPCRPDSLYAVSKVFGESLCRLAAEQRRLAVTCLRIGWLLDEPQDGHGRHVWISPRDLVELVRRCIAARPRFGVYWGVSANGRCPWDNSPAVDELGFVARDDAERRLSELAAPDA
ncbi:MAG: NAD-dependent epimerase/dehydratase family protein [Jatrophihabitans sp.]